MAEESGFYPVIDNPTPAPNSAEPDAEKMSGVADAPNRMFISDLDDTKADSETIMAQYNPTELERMLKVDWARMKSPGLSYRRVHYSGTDNPEMSFDLVFDAHTKGQSIESLQKAFRFLESLCYPRRGASNILEGQAPRALFVWPNFLSLTVVVTSLKWKFDRFARTGEPTHFTVRVDLENVIEARRYLEDVRGDTTPAVVNAIALTGRVR